MGSSVWRREKASSRCVRAAARLRRALGRRDVAVELVGPPLREPGLHQVQAADDAGQQIVEVVRESAGKLADRLHLLRLPQRLLGFPTFLHLLRGGRVRRRQLLGPIGDQRFQRLRSGGSLGHVSPGLVLPPPAADSRFARRWTNSSASSGRSRRDALRSLPSRRWRQSITSGRTCRLVSTTNGMSDQGGCSCTHWMQLDVFGLPNKASSATRTAPAPMFSAPISAGKSRQIRLSSPAR